jgi:ribosomal-protein-alanine N-acetyltransferase
MIETLQITAQEEVDEALIAQCMAVMTKAFDPRFGEAWTAPQLRSMMSLPGSYLVIGRLGERIIGFGLLRAIVQEAELLLLAVDPAERGTGHGRRILDRCLMVAERCGAETVFLEVRSGNPAVHLYGKAGFTQYNLRKGYYLGSDGMRHDAQSFKVNFVRN